MAIALVGGVQGRAERALAAVVALVARRREVAAALFGRVAVDPLAPIRREHVFMLGQSQVYKFSRVVERADGTVWVQGFRRPGHADGRGTWTTPERMPVPFGVVVANKRAFEERTGCLTGERPTAAGLY